jgi:hypothetical protein
MPGTMTVCMLLLLCVPMLYRVGPPPAGRCDLVAMLRAARAARESRLLVFVLPSVQLPCRTAELEVRHHYGTPGNTLPYPTFSRGAGVVRRHWRE